jgi:hypothetical protein
MADQREPVRPTGRDNFGRDNIATGDRSWGVLPIFLGVALVVFLGYYFFGPGFGSRTDRAVTGQRNELPNAAPSAPSVPTPTPPKQQ